MRKFTITLIGLFFIMSSSSMAQEMDLEKVLEKHHEAIGISNTLKAKTIKMKGKIIQQGMEMPGTIYQKRPNKVYIEFTVQGQKMLQVFDGEKGWSLAPMMGITEPKDMNEQEIAQVKEQASMEGALYNWKDKGHTAEYLGVDDMEGSEVYKVKLIHKLIKEGEVGKVVTYFIDSESFLILKTKTKTTIQGSEVEVENFQSNYKKINGIVIPHSLETKMGGNTTMQIVIDEIEIDTEIEDSIFEKPTK